MVRPDGEGWQTSENGKQDGFAFSLDLGPEQRRQPVQPLTSSEQIRDTAKMRQTPLSSVSDAGAGLDDPSIPIEASDDVGISGRTQKTTPVTDNAMLW
eukprot:CAMPEP_0184291936 /NCGR_PEP_ID=MMETSP1049-20130417/3805_1 /TAXON_ID=77928 /ORGANISM="Proteomonas sulcata, Strain CCMP704" /LENGTH=97 /DNA_ID=CAMNT_0026599517 /DNA_START=367 /DNA_END=657 /DNA_ORIENTATION=+